MAKATLSLVDKSDGMRAKRLAKWSAAFLKVLRKTPNVKAACKAARISRETAYKYRREDAEFAAQWADAIGHSVDELEATAFKLATEGDSSLISFLLRAHKPDIYNPTQKHELGVLGGVVFLPQKAEGSE